MPTFKDSRKPVPTIADFRKSFEALNEASFDPRVAKIIEILKKMETDPAVKARWMPRTGRGTTAKNESSRDLHNYMSENMLYALYPIYDLLTEKEKNKSLLVELQQLIGQLRPSDLKLSDFMQKALKPIDEPPAPTKSFSQTNIK